MNDKLDNYKVTFLCSRCRFIVIYHEIRFPLSKRKEVSEIVWIQRRSSGKLSRRRKNIEPCKLIHLPDVLINMCLLSTWLCWTLNCVVPNGDSVPSRLLWLFDLLSLRLILCFKMERYKVFQKYISLPVCKYIQLSTTQEYVSLQLWSISALKYIIYLYFMEIVMYYKHIFFSLEKSTSSLVDYNSTSCLCISLYYDNDMIFSDYNAH